MQHSIEMYASKELGIHCDMDKDFPPCFNEAGLANCDVVFVLIIGGHKQQWCAKLRPVLIRKLSPLLRIWNAQVVVISDEEALTHGFIQLQA